MENMAMKWFRLHTDILNDPKVQTLELGIFKIYINSLCHAAQRDKDGNLGTLFDVSYALRETKSAVSSAFHTLEEIGLIVTVDETFHIPQWKKKQFKSDTSTERVKKHRAKMKRPRNVTVTAPEQNRTETDTEKNKQKDLLSDLLEEDFNQFWEICLRKEAKSQALTNYKKARKTTDKQTIHSAMEIYSDNCKKENTEKKYIKKPSNWLSAEMYLDQLDLNGEQINHTDKGWQVVVKKYQETGRWHDEWGPEPDMNGNRVPQHILRENGFNTTTEVAE